MLPPFLLIFNERKINFRQKTDTPRDFFADVNIKTSLSVVDY